MDKMLTLAIVGSGGAGVIVTGEMCLQAVAYSGGYGHLRKSFGPQIRGGESAAILTLSPSPLEDSGEQCQCLFVLDWKNFDRFQDEIKLVEKPLIVVDEKAGTCPASLEKYSSSMITVAFSQLARENGSEKVNTVFLGYIGYLLGLHAPPIIKAIEKRFSQKHAEFVALALANMESGYRHGESEAPGQYALQLKNHDTSPWILTGNQGLAYGALKAGIRFVAAYPITPASDLLEWIAGHIEPLGGHLVQAEDELSAINMAIGGSYGGVPSMTATSGPGLSLMSEALGLAVSSEIPVVVMNVMRGGPSTGIPTKSEQSDFNLAVYGMHGDAPHVVIAPHSIGDTVVTGGWAVALAEALQTVVIVLSDQRTGQSIEVLPPPQEWQDKAQRLVRDSAGGEDYYRYYDTSSGISAMALPGDPGGIYTAEGLEHNQRGTPSPRNADHLQQLKKRQRKLLQFDFGEMAMELHEADHTTRGAVEVTDSLLICWGSVTAATRQAARQLASQGHSSRILCLRLLSPLPKMQIERHLNTAEIAFVVEQNHQGQVFHYIRSLIESPTPLVSIARPGPVSISSAEIVSSVMNAANMGKENADAC
ncbi:MAG: 2-oxoacid:acceptor oxidoreductase subunit alpha [Proteobacteria bacterium]|nr:2-oxoacid:acceptor oxidoreductase subunit alpha [Pseudomonadota bacterium]